MNILQISTYDTKGGAAKVAWTLKQELESRGHATSMFVAQKLSTSPDVYQIPNNYFSRFLSVAFASDLNFFQSDTILKTEQYRKADIVHCHNLHGYYFNLVTLQKMAQEKPVIWTLHDMWAITPHCAHAFDGQFKNGFYQCPSRDIYPSILWPNEKYLQWKKRSIFQNMSIQLVVPSQWLLQKVRRSILGNQHTSLINNGVNTSVFHKYNTLEIRKKLNLPLDKKIILFIADGWRKTAWKGYDHLYNVMKSYEGNNKVIFLVIGGEKFRTQYAGKNFYALPYLTNQSLLAQYYSCADIFLMTSLAENFPLTILEAMGCGVPIVSFDVGGVKEAVIHKKNGYIAKYRDINDLIRGINYIFELNKKELETMSLNSIKRVKKNFTLEIMTDNYLRLYRSLI